MGLLKEFKEFVMKGNIIDLAVAVIIGVAFNAIVTSLVDDLITPLLLTPALKAAHAQDLDKLMWGAIKYGKFLSAIIKFIVIAVVLFFIVKAMKRAMKEEVVAPPPSSTDKLLAEILATLKNNNPGH